ncbi:MAG TPA: hypothetical protein VFY05_09490 [Candidatus Angelobacter sp.]|nr:hypothetical protein [Candidatus Angelobacter sp.]
MEIGTEQRQRNTSLLAGSLLLVVAVALGFVPVFAQLPGQQALPWVDLLLSVLAVVLVAVGLWRRIAHPERYRGKIGAWVLTVLSGLLMFFVVFGFFAARHLPGASDAPQVGQKAPDFQLQDTKGQTVSLAQLLAGPMDATSTGPRPKALLLIFYRGYW